MICSFASRRAWKTYFSDDWLGMRKLLYILDCRNKLNKSNMKLAIKTAETFLFYETTNFFFISWEQTNSTSCHWTLWTHGLCNKSRLGLLSTLIVLLSYSSQLQDITRAIQHYAAVETWDHKKVEKRTLIQQTSQKVPIQLIGKQT